MFQSKQALLMIASIAFLLLIASGCGKTDHGAFENQANGTGLDQAVIPNIPIDTVSDLMTANDFSEKMLQMEITDTESKLKMWQVGEGTLIVSYRNADSIVTDVRYALSSGGSKNAQHSFSLSVDRFVPASGEMATTISRPNGIDKE